MESIQLEFKVESSNVEETINTSLPIEDVVMQLALKKANAIAKYHQQDIVIGADTLVFYDNQILGKPKNEEDAFSMLTRLSNHTHKVLTGVAICCDGKQELFYEVSQVTFYKLSEEEIHHYIKKAKPFDKAGAYGIQGLGKLFVKEICGDYDNVVGLPIAKLNQRLKKYR